ncbi:MAG: hypothetical protein AAF958_11190 [Planctomycetota bacterium]
MLMGILKRGSLPGYARQLSRVSLSQLHVPSGQMPLEGQVGDLGCDDWIVVPSCSRAVLASHRGLRCNVAYWLREPRAIQNRFYWTMPAISRRYDRVLTYDRDLCRTTPNAAFVAHGGCWIDSPSEAGGIEKTDWMSIIASPKRDAEGHRLRHRVIHWASGAGMPLQSFGREYQWLEDKRDAHESFAYSLVIENSRTSNYFTEKLIDCFVCNSLPIYWGAPEIAEYFDTRGMLICESFEDVCQQIRTATRQLYQSKLPFIRANRIRAMRYANPFALVFDSIRGRCDLPQVRGLRQVKLDDSRAFPSRTGVLSEVAM